MRYVLAIVPALFVALLTFVAVLPWGGWHQLGSLLPLLPMIGIYYWTIHQSQHMPVGIAFVCGMILDALTYGPLGLWALIYVIIHRSALICKSFKSLQSGFGRWLGFSFIIAIAVHSLWAVSSIYSAASLAWWPLAQTGALAVLLYPVFAGVFWLGGAARWRPVVGSMQRGA